MTAKPSSRTPRPPADPIAARTAELDPVGRFEADLGELERIVQQMESGELTLERSLQLFERGIKLGRQCQHSLDTAELRVRQLVPAGDPEDTPDNAPLTDAKPGDEETLP